MTEIHNERQYDLKEIKKPDNFNPELSDGNLYYVRGMEEYKGAYNEKQITYQEALNNRFKEAGVKPRKNSVVAIEFVISSTNDFYKRYSASTYLRQSVNWLEDRYGKENVIAQAYHNDESTPHVHVMVTPIVNKEIRVGNRKQGFKTKKGNRLVARDITGGPDKLRALQQDFYEHVSKKYQGYADWYRGTLVEEQKRHYTKKTSHEIGQLRKELATADLEAAKRIQELIQNKQQEMNVKLSDLQKKVEIRKDRNKGEGWKKGKEFFSKEQKQEKPKKSQGRGI